MRFFRHKLACVERGEASAVSRRLEERWQRLLGELALQIPQCDVDCGDCRGGEPITAVLARGNLAEVEGEARAELAAEKSNNRTFA